MPAFAAPNRLAARGSARSRVRRARPGRRAVRALVALGVLTALLGAGYGWLRESSLVEVREVSVTGVSSSQEARVRGALRRAALGMTTLAVREEELRAAVAPYASVADLKVDAAFPHRLWIEVVERRPAALAVTGGSEIPVDGQGRLLRGVRAEAGLPVVRVDRPLTDDRIAGRAIRARIAVLGAAPGPLRGRLERARSGPRGLTVELRDGPDLFFGSAARIRAKWLAASRVLAASSAQGATYIDARVPEWTAAGGVGPVEPEVPDGTPTPAPVNPQPQP